MKNWLIASSIVLLAGAGAGVHAADQAVVDRYSKTCAICHTHGTANAPKTGDVAAWQERMTKGMDTLVANVNKGINAMPPKGMCFDCSDDEFKALIDYMAAGK